jgi:hypothetical protein
MKQIVDCLTHPVGIEEGHELVTRLDSECHADLLRLAGERSSAFEEQRP